MKLADARIGYAPYSATRDVPGDRRRFRFYANARGLPFDIVENATADRDLVVVASTADITTWVGADASVTIVYDLVDSYLALARWAPKSIGRGLAKRLSGETRHLAWDYRKAIEAMCRRADAVVCSTEEQRRSILEYCDNVHVILDHHGAEACLRKESFEPHRPFRLVWEGLPHTLPAFGELSTALKWIGRRHDVELHLVTDLEFCRYAGRFDRRSTEAFAERYVQRTHVHEWRMDTLAETVASCDLAVVPALLDDPLFVGKPENKLLLLWRMGMPVLTSATPAYVRAMNAAGVDMTCSNPLDWERLLQRYIVDRDAREAAARRGYAYAVEAHSEERLLERWDALFESVGFDRDRRALQGAV